MSNKPFENQDCFNLPLAYDADDTPNTSPIAGGATVDLVVPPEAGRLNLLVVGSNAATVTIYKAAVAQAGSITIPVNTQIRMDVGGMNGEASPEYPNIVRVVAGATSPVSFWFDSTNATGS